MAAREMRPGDWMCLACNNHNFADKIACNKCRVPKPGGGCGKGGAPPDHPYAAPQAAAGGNGRPMRDGDWICPSCTNHNFADKMQCNRCGVPKSAAMHPSMMGGKGGYGKADPYAGFGKGAPVFQYVDPFAAYGKGGPYAGGPPAPTAKGGMRPGDWMCPQCSNHNYADKVVCNKCKAPNTAPSPMMGMAGMGQQMMVAQGGVRPGDWICRACQNMNYANREQCNKCQVPKTTFISKSGMRPGDWVCPSCTNHNWADKDSCVKCGEVKSEGAVKQTQAKAMRPGDWMCANAGCNNHNYESRVACNRCQAPKPIEGAALNAWV